MSGQLMSALIYIVQCFKKKDHYNTILVTCPCYLVINNKLQAAPACGSTFLHYLVRMRTYHFYSEGGFTYYMLCYILQQFVNDLSDTQSKYIRKNLTRHFHF